MQKRRILAIILVACFMFSIFPNVSVFAKDREKEMQNPFFKGIEQKEKPLFSTQKTVYGKVYDPEVGSVADIVYGAENGVDEQSVVNYVYKGDLQQKLDDVIGKLQDVEITQENFTNVLKDINVYYDLKEKVYKRLVFVLNYVESIKDKEKRVKAVLAFEKIYRNMRDNDKVVIEYINKSLKFIKNNKSLFQKNELKLERALVNRVINELMQKYYRIRHVIIHINNRVEKIKREGLRDDTQRIREEVMQCIKNGNIEKALELLEKLFENRINEVEDLKKIGEVLKVKEGKGPKVFVNGKRPDFDVKPALINNRTMVPLRKIANILGVKDDDIQWIDGVIKIKKAGKIIVMAIGDKKVKVNGEEKEFDVAPVLENGRTLVPLRIVSESLECDVQYDQETEIVTVTDKMDTDKFDLDNEAVKDEEISKIVEDSKNVDEDTVLEEMIGSVEDNQQSSENLQPVEEK